MTSPRETWDAAAASFDHEPDHGLHDPAVKAAWSALLRDHLPAPPTQILDVGCGTGSLTLVMSELGHRVVGIDVSPQMLARAEEKLAAAGLEARFHIMDGEHPQLAEAPFDVVLARHIVWMFADPRAVLARWLRLLRPGDRLLLIEGFWHTGAGLHAPDLLAMCESIGETVAVYPLTGTAELWGNALTDERYLITLEKGTQSTGH